MAMTEERRRQLLDALAVVVDSQEIAEEFESANYHGLLDFMRDIQQDLASGAEIGYQGWEDNDE